MCNLCTRDEGVKPQNISIAERMKKKHNIVASYDSDSKSLKYKPDLLAESTQFLRILYRFGKTSLEKLRKTRAYAVVSRTTQPLHVVLAMVVAGAWLSGRGGSARVWTALYVAALAIHLGAQIWMTLISGVVLYFSLARHEFGRVQAALFPVYYAFSAGVSFLALVGYCRAQAAVGFANTSWLQVCLLACVFVIEVWVRARLVRPMLIAKHLKTTMEAAAGSGQEVGQLLVGELVHCPRYLRALRTFRFYHSSVAAGTMLALGCSVYSTLILVDSVCQ